MKRLPITIASLLLFGAIKAPIERSLEQEHRAAFFHGAKLNLALREQIGQGAFIAALSGFRSVIADALWISTNAAWQKTEWGRLVLLFNSITTLQPRSIMFWEDAAWHMGWNASKWARDNPDEPREALRIRAEREYIQVARDYLERGIRNNPDHYVLYDRLAFLLKEKAHDHAGASVAYAKAAEFPDAMGYESRFSAYELSYCPGREKEAYALLLNLFKNPQQRLPTLLLRLRAMEEKLNVPEDQRVYNPPKKHP